MKSLKPFFCYYGGKWRAAPRYDAPRFDTIVEPFAGAAGYSLRHWHKNVILCDKDPIIAGLWQYLISVSTDEIRGLPLEIEDTETLAVCQEAKSLIGFWLNKGTAAPCRKPSAWMRQGIHKTSFWSEEKRERIAQQVEFIRHWKAYCGDYTDAPDISATWFIDPPYHVSGYKYRCSTVDYIHLGKWCSVRKGQVMVCEQYGASWLPFETFGTFKSFGGSRGKATTREVIWRNGI